MSTLGPLGPPDPVSFAALARSSPWQWRTLRFTVRWPGDPYRPDRPPLRVETLDGELVQAELHPEPWGTCHVLVDGVWQPRHDFYGSLDPRAPAPPRDEDGRVTARPVDWDGLRYDDPMYQDYRWVAMLDPVNSPTATAATAASQDLPRS